MADNRLQDLLEHAAAHDQSQELHQQLLQFLEEKQLQLETFQQEILLIERTLLLLSPGNENQLVLKLNGDSAAFNFVH